MNSDDNPRLKNVRAYLRDCSNDRDLVEKLIKAGQEHLFLDWDAPGVNDDKKRAFIADLQAVDIAYPGGLIGYIHKARKLLAKMKDEVNPSAGVVPESPEMVDLTRFNREYRQCENLAMQKLDRIAVVLVAGGLGERLGFSGIKLDIPIEVTENTSYLKHYCSVLKAMESRMSEPRPVPLIIMTSEDTHAKTRASLETNGYFGLSKDQVTLLKQDLVPAISDNDGHLCLKEGEKYKLNLKPHGHGDVHLLLHRYAVGKVLSDSIEYLVFIQDTNGQVFNAAFAAIGVSIKCGFDFNSVAVSRIPGEACGAQVKLKTKDRIQTLNVEYHVLDQLLREGGLPDGDAADGHGHSRFPGNINVLIAKYDTYRCVLQQSKGRVPEFVNPKYTDETRAEFEKPTRLETLMQDFPRLFERGEKVGVTLFARQWCFSADKNKVRVAKKRVDSGGPPESAASAESDFYAAGREKCRLAGTKVTLAPSKPILGIPFTWGPRVILKPSFALSVDEVKSKIKGGSISGEATLVLEGQDVFLQNVRLAGQSALIIKAVHGARVTVTDLEIQNRGFELVRLTEAEMQSEDTPEDLKIRGFRIVNIGARVYEFANPGRYAIDATGRVQNG